VSDVDEVMRRVRDDPGFAARLRADPATVLRPFALEPDDLRWLERELGESDRSRPRQ
jgi:hypothetical protein